MHFAIEAIMNHPIFLPNHFQSSSLLKHKNLKSKDRHFRSRQIDNKVTVLNSDEQYLE
jgi:hypothetical protein